VFTPHHPLGAVFRFDITQPFDEDGISDGVRYFSHLINEHVLVFPFNRSLRENVDSHIIILNFIPEEL
jgi:hypothetical protein